MVVPDILSIALGILLGAATTDTGNSSLAWCSSADRSLTCSASKSWTRRAFFADIERHSSEEPICKARRRPIPCGDCAVRLASDSPLRREYWSLLRSIAEDGNLSDRRWAVMELGRIEPRGFNRPIPLLVRILRNNAEDRDLRVTAALALANIGTNQAHYALRTSFSDSMDGETRKAIESAFQVRGKRLFPLREAFPLTAKPTDERQKELAEDLQQFLNSPR